MLYCILHPHTTVHIVIKQFDEAGGVSKPTCPFPQNQDAAGQSILKFNNPPTLSSSLLMWTLRDSTSLLSININNMTNQLLTSSHFLSTADYDGRTLSSPVCCSWPGFDWLSPGLLWMPAGSLQAPPSGTWFSLPSAENCSTDPRQTLERGIHLHLRPHAYSTLAAFVQVCIVFRRSIEMLTCWCKHLKAWLCVLWFGSVSSIHKKEQAEWLAYGIYIYAYMLTHIYCVNCLANTLFWGDFSPNW